jgi:excinuclease ABC subunit A
MLAADRILDLGPGPGEKGGQVVFFGTPEELLQSKRSLTAQYLRGEKTVAAAPSSGRPPSTASREAVRPPGVDSLWSGCLEILGAGEHNLKGIDVSIPLGKLVCVTGVSGSGKSTLIEGVLNNGLRKLFGKPAEPPGLHRAIKGHEALTGVVLVDQSPIGRTARSNPASYVGAFDWIRGLFASAPLARERNYTPGTFSFNGHGRCPACRGNGFERVEMQFLSDVYLRCPDCDGRRYRAEVLEVTLEGRSIADVLEMTVSEAYSFFADAEGVRLAIEPLQAVGLGYMKLGQPVPTLSGGEAQRLKLSGHLAEGRKSENGRGTLFLFDEPTTGLHFDDIARLLEAFRRLKAGGHSLVVIEHNLDVIRAADWIIDLGPEGGEAGGEVVCVGTPEEVAHCDSSHTGRALREYEKALRRPEAGRDRGVFPTPDSRLASRELALLRDGDREPARFRPALAVASARPADLPWDANGSIRIHNAREHNLKNVDIKIPRDRFTVITGVSGSGKSTVAFDILFAEGQRRYLESLNAYARSFVQPSSRPDVDAIFGIPPTVAIEQRTSRGGRKSTVATLTEIYHFLRLFFVKLGTQHCPDCETAIEAQSPEAIVARVMDRHRMSNIELLAPLVMARKGFYTELARWAVRKGFTRLRVDGRLVSTSAWPRLARFKEHDIEAPVGRVTVTPQQERKLRELLNRALELGKGFVRVEGTLYSTKRSCPRCGRSFAELDPRLFSFNSKHGWCPKCYGTGLELEGFDERQTGEEIWWNEWWGREDRLCASCRGRRIKPEALAVRFRGLTITDTTGMTVDQSASYFKGLDLSGREAEIARDILSEIDSRLSFLKEVGLSYLTLDRAAPTLSGGEAQRIRLAAQLGSNLRGVCYILDEPTIGLHSRDNRRLLATLERLKERGNTVVVVEHDEETIRRAEYVLDLGPGGGVGGGHLIAEGPVEALAQNPQSVTGRFLREPLKHPFANGRRTGTPRRLEIAGARLHNLQDLRIRIPLERLVCVTGVSGSGKSTLVREVLHDNLQRLLTAGRSGKRRAGARGGNVRPVALHGCESIAGWEAIHRVLEVDQTPIGKTPRSCPATYVGIWDDIRRLFARTPEARIRGYGAGRFSFNVAGGRCPDCDGQGLKTIEMSFLPDVKVACEACGGARFNPETLEVRFKEKMIADVLAMSVDEAVSFFSAHAGILRVLRLLHDVGLGYLTLGQQSPTLSGGEAQRIKLVTELARAHVPLKEGAGGGRADGAGLTSSRAGEPPSSRRGEIKRGSTLYVLDEPTIGLHMADVERLIRVLHRLVDAGNTVVLIEHNLDIIAEADWVIDLGPEGGADGGRVVAEGSPEVVAGAQGSHTGTFLAAFLKERSEGAIVAER